MRWGPEIGVDMGPGCFYSVCPIPHPQFFLICRICWLSFCPASTFRSAFHGAPTFVIINQLPTRRIDKAKGMWANCWLWLGMGIRLGIGIRIEMTAVHHSDLSICGGSPSELQITKSQHIDTWFCSALHIWVWLEPTLGTHFELETLCRVWNGSGNRI